MTKAELVKENEELRKTIVQQNHALIDALELVSEAHSVIMKAWKKEE